LNLNGEVLAIQGPPGAGKTRTIAKIIARQLQEGKRVAVTALSHSVIAHVLQKALEELKEQNLVFPIVHVGGDDGVSDVKAVDSTRGEKNVLAAEGGLLCGATGWFLSKKSLRNAFDVLVVDEAAQLSLAQTLASAMGAKNLVLVGDPQQLQQPQLVLHGENSGSSSLRHYMGDSESIPSDLGIFLGTTWRLCPPICSFTSELFYESRLQHNERTVQQMITGKGAQVKQGFHLLASQAIGNSDCSLEQADVCAQLVQRILTEKWTWKFQGKTLPIGLSDILIMAPFNKQVQLIKLKLPCGARVGTVDKFQGQEAPIVIYATTSSSADDAPRGLGFVLDPNRINVATSRAQCVCYVIANPDLYEVDADNVKMMALVNAMHRLGA
jgi:superfamily I DNA and/or RNA helicase